MVEEEVSEELLAANLEAVLASDEGEPGAEFEQEALKVGHKDILELALGHLGVQTQELEVVGVLRDLLDELGLSGRQGTGKV